MKENRVIFEILFCFFGFMLLFSAPFLWGYLRSLAWLRQLKAGTTVIKNKSVHTLVSINKEEEQCVLRNPGGEVMSWYLSSIEFTSENYELRPWAVRCLSILKILGK